VRTFKEAVGRKEGIFVTRNAHDFLCGGFEKSKGSVDSSGLGKREFVILQPSINRLVGVYRKEGERFFISSSPAGMEKRRLKLCLINSWEHYLRESNKCNVFYNQNDGSSRE